MELTAAHWIYLLGIAVIIAVMIARKNVVVPAVAATFLTAWAYTGSLATGLSSVFNASLIAASELFGIFLIIALITALLGALRAMGSDQRMVQPFQKAMHNGTTAFFVLFATTYVISLFFWPTPAVPLIAAILLPAAIRAGLPAMAGAIAIAIAGQGMALSSDYVIQVAPGLSAAAAGVETSVVADRALVLSLVTGLVATTIAFVNIRSHIVAPNPVLLERWEDAGEEGIPIEEFEDVHDSSGGVRSAPVSGRSGAPEVTLDEQPPSEGVPIGRSKAFAVIVPVVFSAMVVYMALGRFTDLVPETSGEEAAALVGGIAAMLLLAATMAVDGWESLETGTGHVVDGLVFAFKAMGVVIPIAGFFFLGNPAFAARIMSLGENEQPPGFLVDLVKSVQHLIPDVPLATGLGILVIGMVTGLEGSGFTGLPLTGSLAGALGPAAGVDPETLAAIGQMGSVWTGGGTLIAWSSLLAVAGCARVSVLDLVRRLFLPVTAGLVVSTIVAVLVF